jgi:glycosyltransferase involved in cell wall biosynthesis
MRILWISPSFLHPTDRGGQIRTLGMMKELHKRHHIHFAALNSATNPEGPARAGEYSSAHTEVIQTPPARNSLAILPQLAGSIFSSLPLAVSRYASSELLRKLEILVRTEHFDSIVCDFLAAAPNTPDLTKAVLFQHNVETTIWQRHAETATSFARKQFFRLQSSKMEAYEKKVCRQSKFVIAVSDLDAARMKKMFHLEKVSAVPTGVDLDYFRKPAEPSSVSADLIFCGSMDWLPNVDAVEHFLLEIFPLIRTQRPETTFIIAGRSPDPRVLRAAEGQPGVAVTGSVPDMRPYLWGSKISVVPIRIGGGTRLKVYECMAASLPVVSTTVGAEGLAYTSEKDILIADTPQHFADQCLTLLSNQPNHRAIATEALSLVERSFSWASATAHFESILEANRL